MFDGFSNPWNLSKDSKPPKPTETHTLEGGMSLRRGYRCLVVPQGYPRQSLIRAPKTIWKLCKILNYWWIILHWLEFHVPSYSKWFKMVQNNWLLMNNITLTRIHLLSYAPIWIFGPKFYPIVSLSVHCEPSASLVQNLHFRFFLMMPSFLHSMPRYTQRQRQVRHL